MLKAAKAYLNTQVSTASKGDLLVMLYDTAIKHLRQAIEKMRAGDMAGKGILITKAITIICELQESLNKERGGDIAKNLFHLYLFCNQRLLLANLKLKPEIVEEVITILTGLRGAFAQILPNQEGVASLTQVATEAPAADAAAAETQPAAEAPQPAVEPQAAAAPQVASTPEIAAALYVPAQVQAARAVAAATAEAPAAAAEIAAAAKTPAPPAPLAAPDTTAVPAASVPGMRLRAANAYATTTR
ncbi:flagellar export chaperone FliS [Humidesulfovibrio idahonensis]